MKKIGFLIFAICFCKITMSQNLVQKNDSIVFRNEFGLDVTSFIKQFFNFNSSQYQTYYEPTYYLTYRFHLKNSNIRAAIGGSYQNKNSSSNYNSNYGRDKTSTKSFDFRIGYEKTHKLSFRWQIFYGLDFCPSVTNSKNDIDYYINGGYATGTKSDSKIIGFAPLLGIKFKINERLSLTTEASISFNYAESFSRNFYTPESNQYPSKPDDNIHDTYNWYTNFNQPIFLILTFDL